MTKPRLESTTSFKMGGNSSSSNVGILALMVRSTAPVKALLDECADAKAADAGRRDREIAFLGCVEFFGLPVVHDGANEARALLGAQGSIGLGPDFAVNLDCGRKAGGDEQVGTLLFDHAPEQVLHQAYCLFAFH